MALPQYYQYWCVSPNANNNGIFNVALHPNDVAPTSPTGGTIWYNASGGYYSFWNHLTSGWQPLANSGSTTFANIGGGTGTSTYLVSGTLRPTGGGIVDANRYNGSTKLGIAYGGTNSTSGNYYHYGLLVFDQNNNQFVSGPYARLGGTEGFTLNFLNPPDENRGVINFGSDDFWNGVPFSFPTGASAVIAFPSTLDAGTVFYNGTGLYLTDNYYRRARLLTELDSLSTISGIVPISKGGTATDGTSFNSNSTIYYNGTSFTTLPITSYGLIQQGNGTSAPSIFTGALSFDIPIWNGSQWVATGINAFIANSNAVIINPSTNHNIIYAASGIQTLSLGTYVGNNDPNFYSFIFLNGSGNITFGITASGNPVFALNEFRLTSTSGSKVSFANAISGNALTYDGTNWSPGSVSAGSVAFTNILSATSTGTYYVSGYLGPTGGGIVNANRFNGSTTLTVPYGGTSATSFIASGILYGQGTSAITSSNSFFWNNAGKSINIGSDARSTVAAINIGNGSEETLLPRPIFSLPSTYSLTATPTTGTIEYNTTGLYLTDGVGSRKRLVNISDTATSGQIAAYNGIYWVPINQTAGGGLTQSQVLARGLGR